MCLFSPGWRCDTEAQRRSVSSAHFRACALELLVSSKWVCSLPDSAYDRNAGKASVFQVSDPCCRHACWTWPSEPTQWRE